MVNIYRAGYQVGRAAYGAYNAYNGYKKATQMAKAKTARGRTRIPRTAGMQTMTRSPLARAPRSRKYYPTINPTNRYARSRKLFYNTRTSGAGSTSSKSKFGPMRVPKSLYSLYKTNQEYLLERLQSNRMTSLFGKQAVLDLDYAHSDDLLSMFDTIPQVIASEAIQETGKFYLKTIKSKLTFTNQDLATCYVKMYEVTPRFHILFGTNPITTWDKGLESQQLVPAANDQFRDAYASPFTSQTFCLYYKVEKVTTFELGQGQSHCHMMTRHVHKPVHGQIVSGYYHLRGLTSTNMIVVSGTPINDITEKTSVSTSSCALDVVEHSTYEYTYAASQRVLRTYQNNLSAVTNAELVSIGAGVVTPEDEA